MPPSSFNFPTVPLTAVDDSVGHRCTVEAMTMQTALEAYEAQHNGAFPAGTNAAALAHSLRVAGLLASDDQPYEDPNPSPGANQWSYDAVTHRVVGGYGCSG
jgi:hypothetical protein